MRAVTECKDFKSQDLAFCSEEITDPFEEKQTSLAQQVSHTSSTSFEEGAAQQVSYSTLQEEGAEALPYIQDFYEAIGIQPASGADSTLEVAQVMAAKAKDQPEVESFSAAISACGNAERTSLCSISYNPAISALAEEGEVIANFLDAINNAPACNPNSSWSLGRKSSPPAFGGDSSQSRWIDTSSQSCTATVWSTKSHEPIFGVPGDLKKVRFNDDQLFVFGAGSQASAICVSIRNAANYVVAQKTQFKTRRRYSFNDPVFEQLAIQVLAAITSSGIDPNLAMFTIKGANFMDGIALLSLIMATLKPEVIINLLDKHPGKRMIIPKINECIASVNQYLQPNAEYESCDTSMTNPGPYPAALVSDFDADPLGILEATDGICFSDLEEEEWE